MAEGFGAGEGAGAEGEVDDGEAEGEVVGGDGGCEGCVGGGGGDGGVEFVGGRGGRVCDVLFLVASFIGGGEFGDGFGGVECKDVWEAVGLVQLAL